MHSCVGVQGKFICNLRGLQCIWQVWGFCSVRFTNIVQEVGMRLQEVGMRLQKVGVESRAYSESKHI